MSGVRQEALDFCKTEDAARPAPWPLDIEEVRHKRYAPDLLDWQRRCWEIVWLLQSPLYKVRRRPLTRREIATMVDCSTNWVGVVEREYRTQGADAFAPGFTRREDWFRNPLGVAQSRGRPRALRTHAYEDLMARLRAGPTPQGAAWHPKQVQRYVLERYQVELDYHAACRYLSKALPDWKAIKRLRRHDASGQR